MITATWFEWTFLVVGIVALITSVATWRDAVMDGVYLSASGKNGIRRLVADHNIRQEGYRLGTSTVMMLVGVSFVFLEPPPPTYYELPQSMVGLLGWIMIAAVQVINSLMDMATRRRFATISDSPNPRNPQTGQAADDSKPADDNPSHAGSISATRDRAQTIATAADAPVRVEVMNTADEPVITKDADKS